MALWRMSWTRCGKHRLIVLSLVQVVGDMMGVQSLDDKKDFKKHNDLPIARIKRIMKSDQDVRMISAETPVIFARACEMFIMDITIRATQYAEYDNERLVLTKKSIADTIKNTDIFDFLMEIL